MRPLLAVVLLLVPTLLAAPAEAGPEWFPYCKDKDVRAGPVAAHVGVDCEPGVYVDVCPPGERCRRVDLSALLA